MILHCHFERLKLTDTFLLKSVQVTFNFLLPPQTLRSSLGFGSLFYHLLLYMSELLTEGVILALGSIDLSILIDPQEKLLEREQLPPPYVPLEIIVAAHMPTLRSPSPTQGTAGGPGPREDLSLRNVQWSPESSWVGESQSVSAELMAGRPG